ncbi:MAG: hypothetical protein ACFC1C_02525 [Candidatus Malihini olakiniferum]
MHNDLDRKNFTINTRKKLIDALKRLTVKQVTRFFEETLVQKSLAMLLQISDSYYGKAAYAAPKDRTLYPNASTLQQALPAKQDSDVLSAKNISAIKKVSVVEKVAP